jgi:hypothetical protein
MTFKKQRRSTAMLSTLCILLAVAASGIETAYSGWKNARATSRSPIRSSNPPSPIIRSSWRATGDEHDRGFRFGSWNRFGHGFGKRGNGRGDEDVVDDQRSAKVETVDEYFVMHDDSDAGVVIGQIADEKSRWAASAPNKD